MTEKCRKTPKRSEGCDAEHIEPAHRAPERCWDRDNIQPIRCSKQGSSSREAGSKHGTLRGVSAAVLVDPERLPGAFLEKWTVDSLPRCWDLPARWLR